MEIVFFLGVLATLTTGIVIGNRVVKPKAFVIASKRLAAGPRQLVDGEIVTLVGTVKSIDLLTAPITGRRCVALHVKAFMGSRWLTRFAMTEFILETEHGPVLVEHYPEAGMAVTAQRVKPTFEVASRFLFSQGRSWHEAKIASFEEQVIEPGDRIAVYGAIAVEATAPEGESTFRTEAQMLRLRGTPKVHVTLGHAPRTIG